MACIEVFAAGDCLAPIAGAEVMAKSCGCDNLTFYLSEWIYFGINKLENSATT